MLHLNSTFSKTMAFVMLMFLTIGQSTALPMDTKAGDTSSFRTTKKYSLQTEDVFPVFFWASEKDAVQLNKDHTVPYNSGDHYLQPMYHQKMYDRRPECWLCEVTLHDETAARAEAPVIFMPEVNPSSEHKKNFVMENGIGIAKTVLTYKVSTDSKQKTTSESLAMDFPTGRLKKNPKELYVSCKVAPIEPDDMTAFGRSPSTSSAGPRKFPPNSESGSVDESIPPPVKQPSASTLDLQTFGKKPSYPTGAR
ncbi:hypothetical protein EV360DRAFT_74340 [Lentinula raphanica]|nr:hypothetical protein EV360DRAFT_74340 [Lentinula raphanica]